MIVRDKIFRRMLYGFMIAFTVLVLAYRNYFFDPFAPDTYFSFFFSPMANAKGTFRQGRFIQSLLCLIVNWAQHRKIAFFVEMTLLSLSYAIAYLMMVEENEKMLARIVTGISLLLIYVNPFYCEWFPFADAIGMAAGVFFSTISVYFFKRSVSFIHIFLSLFFLILASGCYQPTIEYMVFLSAPLIVKQYIRLATESKSNALKTTAFRVAILAGLFVGAGLFQYVFCRFFSASTRVNSLTLGGIFQNIQKIEPIVPELIRNNYSLVQPNIYRISICLLLAFVMLSLFPYRKGEFTLLSLILISLPLLLLVNIVPFTIAKSVWIAPRTITTFMGIPGCIGIYESSIGRMRDNKRMALFHCGSLIVVGALLIIYIYQIQRISDGILITMQNDREIICECEKQIEEYESENETEVDSLCFIKDKEYGIKWMYPVIRIYNINESALGVSWSRIPVFRYVTGKNYKEVVYGGEELPESDSQVLFSGKTAYIRLK